MAAIFSFKDITEQYEHEMAYLRHLQSLESDGADKLLVIESDLTANRVDRMGGQMLGKAEQNVTMTHSEFVQRMLQDKFLYANREAASEYFSTNHLMQRYISGERQLDSQWQVRFQDGTLHWLDANITLMQDPYTSNIKSFFRIKDVTEAKSAQLELQNRSEQDGMTGLLNKATAEARVRARMAENAAPGILVLLDLDDLKRINDNYGHKEGDRAIISISNTLKTHFRESDIIGRIGGDEFMVFLPGAAENKEAIAASLSSLLRKLTGIPIGDRNERRIHCSMGCAVQAGLGDTYDGLFRQADTALYHVKRSGKNNFAFFTQDMTNADYQFKAQRMSSLRNDKKFELKELHHLLSAISEFYQLVISINLSANDYFLMEEPKDGMFAKLPPFGVMDDFLRLSSCLVHPQDVPGFLARLSREALLAAYEQGESCVRHYFRYRKGEEYRWAEAAAIFYTNDMGDLCEFTLVRWASERAQELDKLWLHKVLELAIASSFEYICLISVENGKYFLYNSQDNSHLVPEQGDFEEATMDICMRLIPPDDREDYMRQANLPYVIDRMKSGCGSYTYRYNIPDGEREASFHWFEASQTQLLMTVQRR